MQSVHVKTLRWLPEQGRPEQLMLLFHGVGANAADLAPLAQWLRQAFPQAAVMAFDGLEPFDGDPSGQARQWFSLQGITEANRAERTRAAVGAVTDIIRAAQDAVGLGPQATALVGFSQGAIVSLEVVQHHDGLAGRVLAFAGRYAALPAQAPQATTLHLFHGSADPVIAADHAREAIQHLGALRGDVTIDIADGVGHELPPVLVHCAIQRLRTHIPHRTWAAAMGAVPGLADAAARREPGDD
jgi:phospholipase/carboxylesterase